MTEKTDNKSPICSQQLFPMLLFAVFLFCALFTILIGSKVYENIRERNRISFETDTALAYITNKIRQNDMAGSIAVTEEDNQQFLILSSTIDGLDYETRIYHMDDGLYELFTQKNHDLDVSAGQKIMDCGKIAFSIEETAAGSSMVHVFLDETRHVNILLRSSQEGGADH